MTNNQTILLLLAFYFVPFAIVVWVVYWRAHVEALKTRASLSDMEGRLWQKYESLEGEFARLRIKHFGLFKVQRPSPKAEDWHWTVAEIEERPAENPRV